MHFVRGVMAAAAAAGSSNAVFGSMSASTGRAPIQAIVPALAKFWEISPDGKTYTFELREDARFHNGRKVTAEDCVFSFERLLIRGLNDHNYSYFSRIEGAEEPV